MTTQPNTGTPPAAPAGGPAATDDAATATAAAAAQQGIAQGMNADQTRELVRAELSGANLRLTDEDCERVADVMITRLEKRGAFEDDGTPPAGGPPAPGAPAPVAPAAPPASPAPAGGPDESPRKRTFAERFQGKRA